MKLNKKAIQSYDEATISQVPVAHSDKLSALNLTFRLRLSQLVSAKQGWDDDPYK